MGTGLVHDEIAVAKQPAVEHLDRLGGFLLRGHLHESEAPRAARELVRDDPDALDGTRLLEELPKIFIRGLERQVTDEEL